MRTAFKEWAIVEDALARGEQILILRKGGILEGRGGFQVEHSRFLIFPTLYHQQRESVVPEAQKRHDEIAGDLPGPDRLRIAHWAEAIEWRQLESEEAARGLKGEHIWRDEVIAERFDWGRSKGIFALAVRVFRLPEVHDLPMVEGYGGCKSWIELEVEIDPEGSVPVLDDAAFEAKMSLFRDALGSPAA